MSTLQRRLEPEIMDTPEEAMAYDSMDHQAVNETFVNDLLACGPLTGDVLDLGTGTARIPILLCQRAAEVRVMAVDAAIAMLELARYNVAVAQLAERIVLAHVDAKSLPYPDAYFDCVISNSIVHHIPEPIVILREAVRVAKPGALLFFRDLARPASAEALQSLVETYAGQESALAQKMFADSLHAALTLSEVQELVERLGFDPNSVQMTSDRHWTWAARKPMP
jgi:ubiquinone/menaquinone biosynthesis C-methylase UbiE